MDGDKVSIAQPCESTWARIKEVDTRGRCKGRLRRTETHRSLWETVFIGTVSLPLSNTTQISRKMNKMKFEAYKTGHAGFVLKCQNPVRIARRIACPRMHVLPGSATYIVEVDVQGRPAT